MCVSTGSMLLQTVTNAIAGLSMGAAVLIGQSLGRREQEKAGRVMGASIMFFIVFRDCFIGIAVSYRLFHAMCCFSADPDLSYLLLSYQKAAAV